MPDYISHLLTENRNDFDETPDFFCISEDEAGPVDLVSLFDDEQ